MLLVEVEGVVVVTWGRWRDIFNGRCFLWYTRPHCFCETSHILFFLFLIIFLLLFSYFHLLILFLFIINLQNLTLSLIFVYSIFKKLEPIVSILRSSFETTKSFFPFQIFKLLHLLNYRDLSMNDIWRNCTIFSNNEEFYRNRRHSFKIYENFVILAC